MHQRNIITMLTCVCFVKYILSTWQYTAEGTFFLIQMYLSFISEMELPSSLFHNKGPSGFFLAPLRLVRPGLLTLIIPHGMAWGIWILYIETELKGLEEFHVIFRVFGSQTFWSDIVVSLIGNFGLKWLYGLLTSLESIIDCLTYLLEVYLVYLSLAKNQNKIQVRCYYLFF